MSTLFSFPHSLVLCNSSGKYLSAQKCLSLNSELVFDAREYVFVLLESILDLTRKVAQFASKTRFPSLLMIFCCLHTILIFANFPVRSQGQKKCAHLLILIFSVLFLSHCYKSYWIKQFRSLSY